nr:Eco57I restriction-modification methylase domain-containing protein [Bifidobacterium indicum]
MTEPIHDISVEGFIESFNRRYPTFILKTLLCDRTTGRNIIWADNEYETLGDGYMGDDEITVEKITGMNSGVVKPRIAKEQEKQSKRTKSRAEVFTPSWLCNEMNNDLDETWFGRRDVFNTEVIADYGANTWTTANDPIEFPKSKGHGWHAYVEAPRLEITCGEAPFVCSRYDTVTGDELPVCKRVGFLDRKLRVVTEKTKTRKEWVRRALDALRATYGFEYQGDNLLIARINVLETFVEYLRDRWGSDAKQDELEQAALIISWNFWQMNGFTDAVPTNKMGAEVESTLETFEKPKPELIQPFLFDRFDYEATEETKEEGPKEMVPLCVIYDWQNDEPFEFVTLKGRATAMGKKFYAVIGNPPYQTESKGENNSDTPVYHFFYDSSYSVADKVELISPARFLFRAGSTPSAWNEKMLNDEHVKVEKYYPSSKDVFSDVDIKGGVAIVYRDAATDLGGIGFFSRYEQLSAIINKIEPLMTDNMGSIFSNRGLYRYSELAYKEHPAEMTQTSDSRVAPSSFNRMQTLFTDEKPSDSHEYVKVLGRTNSGRSYKYFRKDYLKPVRNLNCYKTIISKASGTGAYGEMLSDPVIGEPGIAYTETYVSMGEFAKRDEAEALAKYIQTKTCRALLGALKVTQNIAKPIWQFVPLQDFTSNSDIDWSQSVADIDRQLYAKYGLSDDEISFIETHVKEMN